MSIEAEIEATVSAFVAEVMELVRKTALESVRAALTASRGAGAKTPAPAATVTRPRGAGPATVRSFQPQGPSGAGGPPGLARVRTADPNRPLANLLGGPVSVPVTVPPAVVVRRIPPKRRRVPRAAPPAPPPVEAAPTQTPAKNWVVVRRPARDRREAAPEAAAAPAPAGPSILAPIRAESAATSPAPRAASEPAPAPKPPVAPPAPTPPVAPPPLAKQASGSGQHPGLRSAEPGSPASKPQPSTKLRPVKASAAAPTSKPAVKSRPAVKPAAAPPAQVELFHDRAATPPKHRSSEEPKKDVGAKAPPAAGAVSPAAKASPKGPPSKSRPTPKPGTEASGPTSKPAPAKVQAAPVIKSRSEGTAPAESADAGSPKSSRKAGGDVGPASNKSAGPASKRRSAAKTDAQAPAAEPRDQRA